MAYLNQFAAIVREMWDDIKQDGTENLPTLLYFLLLMFFCVIAVYLSTSVVN